jgi:hypothetical protein
MSPSIWTRCEGSSNARKLEIDAFRVVESQSQVATRKLVDSDEEQRVLEELIDSVKPPLPVGPPWRGLHYLLFTPFRHPPLPWGSRFGSVSERGIWYGARELATAFAEVAFYRLLFVEASQVRLAPLAVDLTSFTARIRTGRGIDLTRAPFSRHEAELASKTTYAATQRLGAEMRAAGIEAFLFRSARALGRGTCVGLFAPAFARKSPRQFESWTCTTDHDKVEVRKRSHVSTRTLTFRRAHFEVGGVLRLPA